MCVNPKQQMTKAVRWHIHIWWLRLPRQHSHQYGCQDSSKVMQPNIIAGWHYQYVGCDWIEFKWLCLAHDQTVKECVQKQKCTQNGEYVRTTPAVYWFSEHVQTKIVTHQFAQIVDARQMWAATVGCKWPVKPDYLLAHLKIDQAKSILAENIWSYACIMHKSMETSRSRKVWRATWAQDIDHFMRCP